MREPTERTPLDAAPGSNTIEIRVLEFGTREPVVGAIVRHQPPGFDLDNLPRADRDALLALRSTDVEEFLAQVGTSVRTDADGCCRIRRDVPVSTVVARHESRFGSIWFHEEGTRTILVRPDHTLVVHVRDATGAPAAGAAVEQQAFARRGSPIDILGHADGSGRLEVRHVQTRARVDEAMLPVALRASVPGAASPAVEVDLTAPPSDVRLTLPVCGSVTVRYVEADGQPVDVRYLAEPSIQLGASLKHADGGRESADRIAFAAPLDESGAAHFTHVGLGYQLTASPGFATESVRFAGPTRPGEHVEAELRRSGGAWFVGRAVDPSGSPLPGVEIRIESRSAFSTSGRSCVTTEAGWFRCHFGAGPVGEAASVVVTSSRGISATRTLAAELPVREIDDGRNDLGVVRLEPPHLVLGGRLMTGGANAPPPVSFLVLQRVGRGWSQANIRREVAGDGTFSIHGSVPIGEPVRLRVKGTAFLPVDPIETVAGTTGLEIQLSSAGQVTAELRFDSEAAARGIECTLTNTQAGRPVSRGRGSVSRDGSARWHWGGLVPGPYRLTLRCLGIDAPVHVVDELLVTVGECRDPRLSIDLRGVVVAATVRVTGADGRAVPDRDAFVLLDPEGRAPYAHALRDGRAVVTMHGEADLRVVAPGHRIARREGVTGDVVIGLERAPVLEVVLDLGTALPADIELLLELRPDLGRTDPEVRSKDWRAAKSLAQCLAETAVVESGIARVTLRRAGAYTAALRMRRATESCVLRDLEPATLHLDPSVAAEPVTLRVDPDALREALGGLR